MPSDRLLDARIASLHDTMAGYVERGDVPGIVTLVSRGGAFFPGFWDNRGWGFGVSIILEAGDVPAVPGRFGWDGGYGASWYAHPANDLAGMLMSQRRFPADPFFDDFWTSVYQATT